MTAAHFDDNGAGWQRDHDPEEYFGGDASGPQRKATAAGCAFGLVALVVLAVAGALAGGVVRS